MPPPSAISRDIADGAPGPSEWRQWPNKSRCCSAASVPSMHDAPARGVQRGYSQAALAAQFPVPMTDRELTLAWPHAHPLDVRGDELYAKADARFLETFVTLPKLRSFRTTATALHATPAAIWQRLKALEGEWHRVLVDRESREFRLTLNGEYLLGYAKNSISACAWKAATRNPSYVMRWRIIRALNRTRGAAAAFAQRTRETRAKSSDPDIRAWDGTASRAGGRRLQARARQRGAARGSCITGSPSISVIVQW
ncbi:hypothetical protein LMG27177_06163 [Paraburkholderia fynbosensis]|uniref:HTH lysR-type domain-containing protein n=1 Tax=Paraburkholderia fynbosensis TaxID=1200993 RepID=A0A6J5GTM7_9BURK|nr:hypothetical protein LMG27177_06163 [Paraburkholderia fynbosensis]